MATNMDQCPFDAFGSIAPMTSISHMEKGHDADKTHDIYDNFSHADNNHFP